MINNFSDIWVCDNLPYIVGCKEYSKKLFSKEELMAKIFPWYCIITRRKI